MTQHAKLLRFVALLFVPALASLFLLPSPARADSLTLSAQDLGDSTVLCSSSSNPTTCGTASAIGSLATGTIGAAAGFPQGPPLPSIVGQSTYEGIASAAILYNFTSSAPDGTAVIDLSVTGSASVSNASFPSSTCPLAAPCKAVASIGIASGESFVGAAPGTTGDVLAYISNSGSAGAPSAPIQIVVPISGGLANLSFNLTALAECPALTALQTAEGFSCTAVADYLDPLTITGASIYDSNGNIVPGATLVSQSGFSLTSSATPEPSSIWLLGTGIILLGATKRKLHSETTL